MRWLVVGLATVLAAVAARAQVPAAVVEPSPALACLTTPDPAGPEYPFAALKRGFSGEFTVSLRFTAPDRAPQVVFTSETVRAARGETGSDDFREDFIAAVTRHVTGYRVPCLQPGQPAATLVQQFVFRPDQSAVAWSHPFDTDEPDQRNALKCVVHVDGRDSKPDYPMTAREQQIQGRVLALLLFEGPDEPTSVRVFARPSARRLQGIVADWSKGLRMPCHPGGAVTAVWTFAFVLGNDAYGFKPMTLTQFLPRVNGVRQQTLQIDTTSMGCPFDVRFQYRRPFLHNRVGEVGTTDPARRPLLDWLATADLDLPYATLNSVFGDTTTITVPCLKIDIKP